jgi:hypothetical protein
MVSSVAKPYGCYNWLPADKEVGLCVNCKLQGEEVVMNINDQNTIAIEQIQEGLAALNSLAQEEYQEDLDSILTDPTRTQDERLVRVGRLLGVVLKEPFAVPVSPPPTKSETGAHRAWEVSNNDYTVFDTMRDVTGNPPWQYNALEALRIEYPEQQGWLPLTVGELARDLQNERGFFACLAASTRKYICGDQALKQKIDADLKASQQSGKVGQFTTVALSTYIADILVHHVPALAAGGTSAIPIVSGLLIVIYVTSKDIGIDAFCSWVAQYAPPNARRADDEN